MNFKKIFYHPFWGKRLCPYPFSRIEIGGHKDFVPCCRDWIKYELLPVNLDQDIWNGPQAQLLRRSMLEGSLKYCDQNKCQTLTLSKIQLIFFFFLAPFFRNYPYHGLSLAGILSVMRSKTILNEGPMHVTYTKEDSCNLKCASCRSGILADRRSEKEREALKEEFIHKARRARSLLFSGGEVLYGRSSLSLLKSLNRKDFPNLKNTTIMTNGLLLDELMWRDLGESKTFIKRVLVSIDAGNEEHYKLVRGGNWQQLMSNLNFMSELKRKGEIQVLSLHFVPRLANYRSMPDFVELGERIGADRILFQTFCHWNNSSLDYKSEAVHLKDHPLYEDFLKLSLQVKERARVVWNIE